MKPPPSSQVLWLSLDATASALERRALNARARCEKFQEFAPCGVIPPHKLKYWKSLHSACEQQGDAFSEFILSHCEKPDSPLWGDELTALRHVWEAAWTAALETKKKKPTTLIEHNTP